MNSQLQGKLFLVKYGAGNTTIYTFACRFSVCIKKCSEVVIILEAVLCGTMLLLCDGQTLREVIRKQCNNKRFSICRILEHFQNLSDPIIVDVVQENIFIKH